MKCNGRNEAYPEIEGVYPVLPICAYPQITKLPLHTQMEMSVIDHLTLLSFVTYICLLCTHLAQPQGTPWPGVERLVERQLQAMQAVEHGFHQTVSL